MTTVAITPREMFDNGEMMAEDALKAAIAAYGSLEDKLEPLTAQKDAMRQEIDYLLDFTDGKKIEYGGYTVKTINGSQTVSYDATALDKVIFAAMASGEVITPQAILACRKETTRSGYVRMAKLHEQKAAWRK